MRGRLDLQIRGPKFLQTPLKQVFVSKSPILKVQPPTLKQSRAGAIYQLAITRQSVDGVVGDNRKAAEGILG